MLLELKVTQMAIIDELTLSFGPGLNIISGETGAGKSVLLKSLSMLMGAKTETDVIRDQSPQATIEGYFDITKRPDLEERLQQLGIPLEEQSLIVRRVVGREGKSRVFLNGHLAPLSSLRELVAPLITVTGHYAPLIELTGQHDSRHLQSASYHLELLDQFAGSVALRETLRNQFEHVQRLRAELRQLETDQRQREQRGDFLRYQIEEIRGGGFVPGDEIALEQKIQRLRNAARLSEFVGNVQDALYGDDGSVSVRLHQLLQKGSEMRRLDESLGTKLEPLAQAKALVEDVVYEMRNYARGLQGEESDLDLLEERLSQLRKLQKKFGESVEEILRAQADMETELSNLDLAEGRIQSIEKEIAKLELELKSRADDLHARRSEAAVLLAHEVNLELKDLNMKGVAFGIDLTRAEIVGPTGNTNVEFTIQSSPKDAPKPMAKVASGGELSRILLSLKRVLGAGEQPRTYLFDEVDTGVSGQTAEKVGRKLKEIAQGQQVICVTHLAQVAAFADHHYRIEKLSGAAGTTMRVAVLNSKTRVDEIARLISGEKISKTSLEHARELLKECQG